MGVVDNLNFTYIGNQLIKVEDMAISLSLSMSMDFIRAGSFAGRL